MSAAVPSPAAERRDTTISRDVTGATSRRRATGRHEPARDRSSTPRLTARAVVLCVVVLFLLTLAVAPLRGLIDQRRHLARLERQAEVLTGHNARLEDRIDLLNDPRYLERVARQCLGLVRPGETAFVMVPTHGALPSPEC
jgi:cell division protein FtsB